MMTESPLRNLRV
jgi:hypothetical protein